jgi:ABC-2 type transport system ATP-binding protein
VTLADRGEGMINTTVEARITEIEELVAANDLNAATKRLMDFVTDFAMTRKQRRDVINTRGTYSELREDVRAHGKSSETDIRTRRLRSQVLDFLYELVDEGLVKPAGPEKLPAPEKTGAESCILAVDDQTSNNQVERKTDLEVAKEQFIQKRKQIKPPTTVVYEGKGVAKTYDSESIDFTLQPIDLQLKLGEITAVVGENGSGKTTLLEIIAGRLTVSEGEIAYPHLTLNDQTDVYAIQQQIAYIPQELPPWPGLLADTLHFTAASRGIKGQNNIEEVDFIISRLGLDKYRRAGWDEISGGYKTRFSLAKVLIWHPKLIVLDEPLANLDINTQLRFLQDLRHLTNSVTFPMTVVASSQHLHRIESIADNIIFLHDGQAIYNDRMTLFGENRTENIFELACDLSKDALTDSLEKIAYTRIDTAGDHFIVHTSRSVTDNDILQIFVENHIPLGYFRDISKSTRQLFEGQL